MNRRFLLTRVLPAACLGLALLGASPAARALDVDQAKAFVDTVARQGIEDVVQADLPQDEKIARFRDLFTTYFDVPSIARFVLGRYWRQASPEEQQRFVELFKEVNVYTWARRFKDYSGQELAVVAAQMDGDKGAFVDTRVDQTGGQAPMSVRWRLRAREDGPMGMKVVDLVVEGVSMAITYRSEYASVIEGQGGVKALNDLLEQQVSRLKGA